MASRAIMTTDRTLGGGFSWFSCQVSGDGEGSQVEDPLLEHQAQMNPQNNSRKMPGERIQEQEEECATIPRGGPDTMSNNGRFKLLVIT